MAAEPVARTASERVELEAPLDFAFQGVIRLIVGGIAEQAQFGYEAMDDLQLAIERLLAEAGGDGRVTISFELGDGAVRTRIGPLREGRLAELLQEPDGDAGTLTLRRILSTVVDSFGVEQAADGQIVIRMEKLGIPRS
jgi:anti-sigma regulatory factor (Ser/Thr protein kinase)